MNAAMQRRIMALGAIVIAAVTLGWISMGSLGENLVYYWSPTELMDHGDGAIGATVRLGGMVVPGSVDWQPDAQTLGFQVTDGTNIVTVSGQGAPPQMFREGIGVVVEGKLGGDGVFHTQEVFVKHSNEYRAPEDGTDPGDAYSTLVVEGS